MPDPQWTPSDDQLSGEALRFIDAETRLYGARDEIEEHALEQMPSDTEEG